jgi:hypothetical protein
MAACSAHAQPGNPTVRNYYIVSEVPAAQEIPSGQTAINPDSAIRLGTDSISVSGRVGWNADCKDGGKGAVMRLARARFRGDTLVITIFRPEKIYVHELEIRVWGHEFRCDYRMTTRNGLSTVDVLPTDQVLVLQKSRFNTGESISGYVNFRGTLGRNVRPDMPWDTRMDWVESDYVVRGAFRVRIE